MAKSSELTGQEIHSIILFVIRYLGVENSSEGRYVDSKILLKWSDEGFGIKRTYVTLKLPEGNKEVFIYDSYVEIIKRYNKGFWIDYLKHLSELSEAEKIIDDESKKQTHLEREQRLFGKIDDSELFDRKGK